MQSQNVPRRRNDFGVEGIRVTLRGLVAEGTDNRAELDNIIIVRWDDVGREYTAP